MGIELNLEFPQICGFKLEMEMLLNVLVQKHVHIAEKKKSVRAASNWLTTQHRGYVRSDSQSCATLL